MVNLNVPLKQGVYERMKVLKEQMGVSSWSLFLDKITQDTHGSIMFEVETIDGKPPTEIIHDHAIFRLGDTLYRYSPHKPKKDQYALIMVLRSGVKYSASA